MILSTNRQAIIIQPYLLLANILLNFTPISLQNTYFYKQSLITMQTQLQQKHMKNADSDSDNSEPSQRSPKRHRLIKRTEIESDTDIRERTRSRNKLSYNHQPDQPQQTKTKILKEETKLEKKYMADAKVEKQELKVKEMKEQIKTKEEDKRKAQSVGQIPIKMTKGNIVKNQRHLKILDQADQDAQALVKLMAKAHDFDKKSIKKGKIACQRIRILEIIREKTKNLVVKRKFIQKGGLEQMCLWLLPMQNKQGKMMEPCIAVKMGLLRIVHDMGLDSLQIKDFGSGLWQILRSNKRDTRIPQLKNLCSQILTLWDYTAFSRFSSSNYYE